MTAVSPPARRASRGVKIAIVFGLLVIVALGAALSIRRRIVSHRPSQKHAASYSSQIALPFTKLAMPVGIAVDAAGDSYVADFISSEVWKLASGADVPTLLPFNDIKSPTGVAVDTAGNLSSPTEVTTAS